ncbi:UBA/THIF-type NAD/FAD binding protein [Oceanobacillus picturae]|uniref:UBA/THIF-type NAD/FAD binding protein n=1 Tax=Oceanobacillus picturae TaxID=171693 RepID=A0A0U9H589_9BACI|nr:UBA/THIF-type NAD/FAD binding protein [Oceanobacillus picturae]
MISKNTNEKTLASTQAKKRFQALRKDCFLEGWIQRIVKIPAETKFDKPRN